MTRRSFLGGALATGAALDAGAWSWRFFSGSAADFDENLAVLVSDLHIGSLKDDPTYPAESLKAVVADILRMDPLPRQVIGFGDVAFKCGRASDYAAVKGILKPLSDAGIRVRLGCGNHDHRAAFFEAFPELVSETLVPGRNVFRTSVGGCDLLMLDTLDERLDEKEAYNNVPGTIPEDEQVWLRQELDDLRRPTLVCAHHPLTDERLLVCGHALRYRMIMSGKVIGFVHGHDHRWQKDWQKLRWTDRETIRTLCLPSTGVWGDVGYVTLRADSTQAVASLVQRDFYFPRPLPREDRPKDWDAIVRENQGATCAFSL